MKTAHPQDRDYRLINVPAHSLNILLDSCQPDVVLADIEGEEKNLFHGPLGHKPRLLIIEIHDFYIGETESVATVQRILDHGYRLVDRSGWSWVFSLGA